MDNRRKRSHHPSEKALEKKQRKLYRMEGKSRVSPTGASASDYEEKIRTEIKEEETKKVSYVSYAHQGVGPSETGEKESRLMIDTDDENIMRFFIKDVLNLKVDEIYSIIRKLIDENPSVDNTLAAQRISILFHDKDKPYFLTLGLPLLISIVENIKDDKSLDECKQDLQEMLVNMIKPRLKDIWKFYRGGSLENHELYEGTKLLLAHFIKLNKPELMVLGKLTFDDFQRKIFSRIPKFKDKENKAPVASITETKATLFSAPSKKKRLSPEPLELTGIPEAERQFILLRQSLIKNIEKHGTEALKKRAELIYKETKDPKDQYVSLVLAIQQANLSANNPLREALPKQQTQPLPKLTLGKRK